MTTAWFEEQRRLTPDELQSVRFPASGLGRHGYEEAAVNGFVRKVHAEFVRLINERASLWQDVQRLRQRILAGDSEGERQTVLLGEADAHVHAMRLLSAGQAATGRFGADVRSYRSRLTEAVRRRRDDVLREAQLDSDAILEESHARASEAAISALNAAPPQTDRGGLAAQAELAYQRTYSNVYRARLRAYTEGVLRGLEEWERRETISLSEPESVSLQEAALGHAEQRSVGY